MVFFNPLPPDRHYCDDVSTNDMLVNFLDTFLICLKHKMHIVLQTIRKSVQKKVNKHSQVLRIFSLLTIES